MDSIASLLKLHIFFAILNFLLHNYPIHTVTNHLLKDIGLTYSTACFRSIDMAY